jgi:thiosulfate reductase / polysulfide reductase chain A
MEYLMNDQIEVKKTTCMWCHSHCQVELYVKNGQLEKVEEDKSAAEHDKALRQVRACPRAQAAAEWVNHPDRLNYPLKRAGEKGEGKWQQIDWEQALDEIAEKLKKIKDRYGAEAIASTAGTLRTNDEFRYRFHNLLGSPNIIGTGLNCYGPGYVAAAATWGHPVVNFEISPTTKLIMMLGVNPDQADPRQWRGVSTAVNAGAKLIVVDPRRTALAQKAAIWLQIRPGTDCALNMSLINVIINEKLYDKEFVDNWCYGFDKLTERAQDYPPEKVAEITWIPAERIRETARLCATIKPACIYHMLGLEHQANVIEAVLARNILTAITGNLDVAGGLPLDYGPMTSWEWEAIERLLPEQERKEIGCDKFKLQDIVGHNALNEYAIKKWARTGIIHAHGPMVYRAAITGKPYPVRAMLTTISNPLLTIPNTKMVYKALKSLDLYVVMDFWMTPSAELADYVLPAASWLERPVALLTGVRYCSLGEAALPAQVEGKYDRRPDYALWQGLGVRMGQEKDWWPNFEKALDSIMATTGHGFYEFIRKNGHSIIGPREERKYEKTGFGTKTGKCELYSTLLERLGYDPLPKFYEPPESPISTPELARKYPLILINGGRFLPMYNSEHRQIDSLRKQHPEPLIQINPETATRLGISDGDWVWIETLRGRVRQKCQFFDGIDPRVVHAEHGWWFPELPGEEPWLHGVWESNINIVTDDNPDVCNRINGGQPLRGLLCKVYPVKTYIASKG